MGGRVDSDIIFDLLNTDTALGSGQDAEIRVAPAPKSSPSAATSPPPKLKEGALFPRPDLNQREVDVCISFLSLFPAAGARPDVHLGLSACGFVGMGLGWMRLFPRDRISLPLAAP